MTPKPPYAGFNMPTFPESSHVIHDCFPFLTAQLTRKLLPFLAQQPVQQVQFQMWIKLTFPGQNHLQKLCRPNPDCTNIHANSLFLLIAQNFIQREFGKNNTGNTNREIITFPLTLLVLQNKAEKKNWGILLQQLQHTLHKIKSEVLNNKKSLFTKLPLQSKMAFWGFPSYLPTWTKPVHPPHLLQPVPSGIRQAAVSR